MANPQVKPPPAEIAVQFETIPITAVGVFTVVLMVPSPTSPSTLSPASHSGQSDARPLSARLQSSPTHGICSRCTRALFAVRFKDAKRLTPAVGRASRQTAGVISAS